VQAIHGSRVFVDHIVKDAAQQHKPIKQRRRFLQMLANLYAINGRIDRIVVGARYLRGRIALYFRVPHIDVTRPTSKPDKDATVGFATACTKAIISRIQDEVRRTARGRNQSSLPDGTQKIAPRGVCRCLIITVLMTHFYSS
jgi:hypothetical protein